MEENLKELWSKVNSLIDPKTLIDLALTLGNIDSPAGQEAPAGDYLLDWLRNRGFAPKKIGLVPDRFCVAGSLPGTGGGLSLLFNAHMDTSIPDEATLTLRPAQEADRLAWVDGDYIIGKGVVNDKGPMAAFLIAADAIRRAGTPLKGEIVLTMVPGEIDDVADPDLEVERATPAPHKTTCIKAPFGPTGQVAELDLRSAQDTDDISAQPGSNHRHGRRRIAVSRQGSLP